ncbi:MAG: hypothetical protein K2O06_15550 [Acetatifactor sp.]|nr:hypothetical protein [Acetatifactor sp.]
MSKFKVGDKVNVTTGNVSHIGTILEVCQMPPDLKQEVLEKYQEYWVSIDGKNYKHVYSQYMLDYPPKPKSEELKFFESTLNQAIADHNKDEFFFEMATIAIDNKLNINVNPEVDRLSIAYFKVLNAESFRKATKVARLHFKDSGMEYHKDRSGKQPWELNSQEIKHIVRLMKEPNDGHDGYTNWQIACYQWNLENGLVKSFKDYFAGKYDHMYDNDDRLKEAYVPSTQEMPETWIYNPKK